MGHSNTAMMVHYIMAMIKKTIVKGQKPTHEQLMELEAASKMPIVYDEDVFVFDMRGYGRHGNERAGGGQGRPGEERRPGP